MYFSLDHGPVACADIYTRLRYSATLFPGCERAVRREAGVTVDGLVLQRYIHRVLIGRRLADEHTLELRSGRFQTSHLPFTFFFFVFFMRGTYPLTPFLRGRGNGDGSMDWACSVPGGDILSIRESIDDRPATPVFSPPLLTGEGQGERSA